jgi:hypothetical protein
MRRKGAVVSEGAMVLEQTELLKDRENGQEVKGYQEQFHMSGG